MLEALLLEQSPEEAAGPLPAAVLAGAPALMAALATALADPTVLAAVKKAAAAGPVPTGAPVDAPVDPAAEEAPVHNVQGPVINAPEQPAV